MPYLIDFSIVLLGILILITFYKYYKRSFFYEKYKSVEDLSAPELLFYYRLARQLPRGYKIICKPDIDDIISNIKIGRKLECIELASKYKNVEKHDVDIAVLNKRNKFICGINIENSLPEGIPEIYNIDDQVEILFANLNIPLFVYKFENEYNFDEILKKL
ncbi:MAG TPA: hypothetical protein DCL21_05495 [Alphaproteobacteria bacterium]|nr:hypothetical protein [Alphaproteobacteria bacterium]